MNPQINFSKPIKLRGGATTFDPRLNRVKQFDPRSKKFGIRALNEGKVPRSYTWRCFTYLDQGQEGSCVGHGAAHELAARPAEVQNIDHGFATYLYHEAQKVDQWPGGSYPGADPSEFYEGTSVLAVAKVLKAEGWCDSYRWAFGEMDLRMGVGRNGPAIIGVIWTENMSDTDQEGFIHPTGRVAGGHCVLVRAVNVKQGFYTIRNSWGSGWGVGGDCYITFEDMAYLLEQDGEAVFLLNRHGNKVNKISNL